MERPFRNFRTLIPLFTVMWMVPGIAQATTLDSYWRNREGVKKYGEQSYLGAHQSFLRALENDPLTAEIHLNLALTYQANEEFEKAEQAYSAALKILPEDSVMRFEALFNLALVYSKQRKIEEALAAYQAALAINPDSKEVKTNIELMWNGGGGGGKGKNQDKDKKDQEDKDPNEKEGDKQDKEYQNGKESKPRPFESQDLSPQNVKKILDEIKNQEQSIRADEYERNTKEAPRGKDW